MERFQHSLETINRRFHQVLSALCAMAPKLITRPSFTETHARITNNPDFYPFFKRFISFYDIVVELHRSYGQHVGTGMDPRVDQNRYRFRKGGLAQNVLAICDFDMNFTYVYAGWKGSVANARVLDHAVSHDNTFPFPPIGKYYLVDAGFTNYQCFLGPYRGTRYHLPEWRGQGRPYGTPQDMFNHVHSRYLESAGFPQDLHWTLNIEQRFMWMIVDDNTRAPMRDDALAEAQMGHWARGLRRHFGYLYTATRLSGVPVEDQGAAQDNESINSLRSPVRGGVDVPIVISDSAAPSVQTHTHIASWDAVEHVARGDGGPQMAHCTSLAARRSLDMGSKVGGIGSWIDYIRHFGVQSDRGAQLTVMETAQRAHADHRDSHLGRVTVLRRIVPTWKMRIKCCFNPYKAYIYC
ncbi:UNVERIFIED_CONTAM: hypothetical protein Sradi_5843800 [Sesamum radiatum]|uniref:DDE Tnp4 domain-containing protein n=1 Tax=Sesamum radiatum TaxID=300843 RepID=A0AAW2KPM9_SESRA